LEIDTDKLSEYMR